MNQSALYNNLKTFLLLAALTALITGLGAVIGGRQGLVLALGFALVMNFFSYWFSDKIALRMSGAQEVSESEAPQLHAMIAHLAQQAGLPKPRVAVIDDPSPNAFATGRDPRHGVVAVTSGIQSLLTRGELEGVIAHELAHIKHRDILIGSIAAVLAGAIASLAHMLQFGLLFGGRDDEDNPLGIVGALAAIIVAPMAAMLIQMAVSRSREFEADRGGALICGQPLALAGALQKLERGAQMNPMPVNPATAHMYIVNPLQGLRGLFNFSTHPATTERVARLEAMAREQSLPPQHPARSIAWN